MLCGNPQRYKRNATPQQATSLYVSTSAITKLPHSQWRILFVGISMLNKAPGNNLLALKLHKYDNDTGERQHVEIFVEGCSLLFCSSTVL
jgi:hypothetical protein